MNTHELIADLSRDLRPVKPLASPLTRFTYWIVVASVLLVAASLAFGLRGDLPGALLVPRVALDLGLSLMVALLSAVSAFYLAVPGEQGWRRSAGVGLAALAVWTGHTVFRVIEGYSYDRLIWAATHGYDCFAAVVVMGVLPGVLLFGMLRRAAPTEFLWSGAMGLLAMGALGSLGAQLHCAGSAPFHILIHHFFPVLLVGGLGLLLGRHLLQRSSRH